MITRLRRRHSRTWLVMLLLIPATLLVAFLARREPAWMERLPAELTAPLPK
jgi:hypothetical protein